mmetsp:Transcript_10032/g.20333  ORF Transcript_10032/g.20333 Transcript_10032/m.20333 type:complete len:110 (-) Transcript_10032:886-1215(-)
MVSARTKLLDIEEADTKDAGTSPRPIPERRVMRCHSSVTTVDMSIAGGQFHACLSYFNRWFKTFQETLLLGHPWDSAYGAYQVTKSYDSSTPTIGGTDQRIKHPKVWWI